MSQGCLWCKTNQVLQAQVHLNNQYQQYVQEQQRLAPGLKMAQPKP